MKTHQLCSMVAIGLMALMGCQNIPNQTTQTSQPTINQTMKTTQIQSQYSFDETVHRLKHAFISKNMKIFAEINHQQAAKDMGLSMQPATVLVFGTPKAGTPLMVKDPTFALQLPLKVLITEIDGKVMVAYTDSQTLIKGSQITFDDVKNTLANAEKLIVKTVTE